MEGRRGPDRIWVKHYHLTHTRAEHSLPRAKKTQVPELKEVQKGSEKRSVEDAEREQGGKSWWQERSPFPSGEGPREVEAHSRRAEYRPSLLHDPKFLKNAKNSRECNCSIS